ncbi:MAG: hypothetical protein ABJA87_09190 [bacterium]
MTAPDGSIVPIRLTLNERSGLTLWAPPWEDEDGEQWLGFLGDGAKIVLFPSAEDLAEFVATTPEHDLSDHPGWPVVQNFTPAQFRPAEDNRYDLDAAYEWAAEDPTPATESQLANVVEMVLRIAEACEDGGLRRLIGATPEYADLMEGEGTYTGREGSKAWTALGDTIASTWERALRRVETWLDWRGDFEDVDGDAADADADADAQSLWARVGARPIELVLAGDDIVLTVRGEIEDKAVFLGADGDLDVFLEPEDLAEYARRAEEHDLIRLEFWDDVRDAEDEAFVPEEEDSYDLTMPTARGAQLLRDLADFLDLDADIDFLDHATVDQDEWDALIEEVASCFDRQD